MSDEYLDYGTAQRLGESGITLPCIKAMAAILTSAYRPEKITAVIHPEKNGHESVLFLVWKWFCQNITVIPDGFGTHGGEGGRGLSDVLGLIKYYNVPLLEVWMYDEKMFDKLAQGELTEEIFEEIQEGSAYNWSFYDVSSVQKVIKDKQKLLEVGRLIRIPLP